MDGRHESLIRAQQIAPPLGGLLLLWYEANQRPLPWRGTSDPYAIWLSEVMLQQTQVEAVIPYYLRFLKAFPTIEALARAPLEGVLKLWENMGYYSRARHLHAAARVLAASHGGRLPDNPAELRELPGIGAYTSGAILSIAFGKAVPAVDGNVKRVLSRIFTVNGPLNTGSTQRLISALAEALIPKEEPGRFNQALMDLGAMLCRPRIPRCAACPLTSLCLAFIGNCQHRFPVAGKRAVRPRREAAVAVIRDGEERLLVIRRPERGFLGGLWTFPGGMLQPGETAAEALEKRCREELEIAVAVGKSLITLQQAYTHFQLTLHVFFATLRQEGPQLLAGGDRRWASPGEIPGLPFSRAEQKVLAALFP